MGASVQLRFNKYEGLGNDFVIVEAEQADWVTPELARALCDRHFGVGGDGVLFVGEEDGKPSMRVINADGSEPEMCGNGLRCVALYLAHEGRAPKERFEVQTGAGPHACLVSLDGEDGEGGEVAVDMRPASLSANEVLRDSVGERIDAPFDVDGQGLHMTAVSMGNPHAVFFDDVGGQAEVLGPRIEKDERFRAGANVGFAQMTGEHALDLRVWERGVGWTLACGTGACAAAVAAVVTGRASGEQPVQVKLPGGPLQIEVTERGSALRMTGPARRVFSGSAEVKT